MVYTAKYFIDKFLAIPDEQWGTGSYVSNDGSKKCALGHCNGLNTVEGRALCSLFTSSLGVGVTRINDGSGLFRSSSDYLFLSMGDTPKERVLTALELIEAGVRI